MSYKCVCGKKYVYKSQYERHINKKKSCLTIYKKVEHYEKMGVEKSPFYAQNLQEKNRCNLSNNDDNLSINSETNENIENNLKICKYCEKKISTKHFSRHIIYACKEVPKYVKENYILKFNKHQNTKDKNKISVSSFKKGNGINNANLINIKNISDYDNDDYSHLTKDEMIKICKSGFNSYTLLMELLQKNNKNINFMIKNLNKDDVHVIKNNKIKLISKNEFTEGKMDRIVFVLGDIFIREEIYNELSDKNKLIFEDVLDIDKYKEGIKYFQYANDIFRTASNSNQRNKEIFLDNNLL